MVTSGSVLRFFFGTFGCFSTFSFSSSRFPLFSMSQITPGPKLGKRSAVELFGTKARSHFFVFETRRTAPISICLSMALHMS